MEKVILKNMTIERGKVRICVPVTGQTDQELEEQAEKAVKTHPDLIEWRADFYQELLHTDKIRTMGKKLRKIIGDIPVIFTVRTKAEGGNIPLDAGTYEKLLKAASETDEVQIIDMEIMMDGLNADEIIKYIHDHEKYVMASNHCFDCTPSEQKMHEIFRYMEEKEADIRKLAVMPVSDLDVISLMKTSAEESLRNSSPVVAVSMGKRGKISRISGRLTGSCITFAAAGSVSAPGQMTVDEVRKMLKMLE